MEREQAAKCWVEPGQQHRYQPTEQHQQQLSSKWIDHPVYVQETPSPKKSTFGSHAHDPNSLKSNRQDNSLENKAEQYLVRQRQPQDSDASEAAQDRSDERQQERNEEDRQPGQELVSVRKAVKSTRNYALPGLRKTSDHTVRTSAKACADWLEAGLELARFEAPGGQKHKADDDELSHDQRWLQNDKPDLQDCQQDAGLSLVQASKRRVHLVNDRQPHWLWLQHQTKRGKRLQRTNPESEGRAGLQPDITSTLANKKSGKRSAHQEPTAIHHRRLGLIKSRTARQTSFAQLEWDLQPCERLQAQHSEFKELLVWPGWEFHLKACAVQERRR